MHDFSVKLETNKEQELTILLEGNLVISNIKDIGEQLFSKIGNYSSIHIKGNDIKDIDLSMIQILCTLQNSNYNVCIELNLREDLQELIEHSGFTFIH
jgi:hypothetical protein